MRKRFKNRSQASRVLGYRSGLEERISEELKEKSVDFGYEVTKIKYQVPPRNATYTPDFTLPNGIIIETKGYWPSAERKKMQLVKEQNPDLDIRIIFSNPNNKISKSSKTTYGDIANKLGYPWISESDSATLSLWINEIK